MSQYNYIFYDIHRILNMRVYTDILLSCAVINMVLQYQNVNDQGYNKYARHNTNSCMVNKIFLSHSMPFVKLTVDFYVTHTDAHNDGACCSAFAFALIQFNSDSLRLDDSMLVHHLAKSISKFLFIAHLTRFSACQC